jgi:hypothetical protein
VKTAIAYTRVSTRKQGLGLSTQQQALAAFAKVEGYHLIQTFTDVETGKGSDTQQIDFHIGIGLNKNAPAYVFGAGYSFRMNSIFRL